MLSSEIVHITAPPLYVYTFVCPKHDIRPPYVFSGSTGSEDENNGCPLRDPTQSCCCAFYGARSSTRDPEVVANATLEDEALEVGVVYS